MSYLDRLRQGEYLAPSGDVFFFNVDTLERSGGKKGATQEILDSDQSISQDQGNKTDVFVMPLYFTGEDYDLDIDDFEKALKQRYSLDSPGTIFHPRWGNIDVFPFLWVQKEELIDGARVGRLDVTFREIFPLSFPKTDETSLSDSLSNVDAMTNQSLESAGNIDLTTAQSIASMAGKMRDAVGIISNNLKEISETIQEVQDVFDTIESAIDGAIDDIAGNIVTIMAQTQILMRTPGRIIAGAKSKISVYRNMIEELSNNFFDQNETIPVINKNNAIASQLVAGFSVAAMAEAVTFNDFTKRTEVLSSIDSLNDGNDVFDDTFEETRSEGDISQEFSGDHNFFSLLNDTVTRINSYMLNTAFDLKAEKRLTLKNNDDIISVVYSIYKNVQPETIEDFIDVNKIVNDEFIQLDKGREIVAYI